MHSSGNALGALALLAQELGYHGCCCHVSQFVDSYELVFFYNNHDEYIYLTSHSLEEIASGQYAALRLDVKLKKLDLDKIYEDAAQEIAKTISSGGTLVICDGLTFDLSTKKFIDSSDKRIAEFMVRSAVNGWIN